MSWVRQEHSVRDLAQLDARAQELGTAWLQTQLEAGRSASTLQTQRAALRMFHGDRSVAESVQMPTRHREEITRSRGEAAMDREFQPKNHQALINFLESTGLRRREITALTAEAVRQHLDGSVTVMVDNGKGGKAREVPVLPGREADVLRAVEGLREGQRVFDQVPVRLDIHSIRREYAQELYKQISGRELPPSEGRLRPSDYDRAAAAEVSEALGHSRVDVVHRHYLR